MNRLIHVSLPVTCTYLKRKELVTLSKLIVVLVMLEEFRKNFKNFRFHSNIELYF